jgi:hypothetical protein
MILTLGGGLVLHTPIPFLKCQIAHISRVRLRTSVEEILCQMSSHGFAKNSQKSLNYFASYD